MIEIKHTITGEILYTHDGADLFGASLCGANLRGANLCGANLCEADLSASEGLLVPSVWLAQFERDETGILVYKAIGGTTYAPPSAWTIEPGSVLSEVVNPDRTCECGCGVNFGTEVFVRKFYLESDVWLCRIPFDKLSDVVVPYNTDGKARCGYLELVENLEG